MVLGGMTDIAGFSMSSSENSSPVHGFSWLLLVSTSQQSTMCLGLWGFRAVIVSETAVGVEGGGALGTQNRLTGCVAVIT
ncbi:hypothetical protein AXG93_2190s1120 [Marchantia polymorpha subsp. ruderalis]|uniref:Uncharacterized protein n=1 Tax=Marchantia polymorpha subsp. ruderalis TaxID=1480154 RepID=A0A176WIX1_MARPO|nr:hypothetical protein AXG93_2190s1120 [Marchantia polymorpha subsp. ruderalis]